VTAEARAAATLLVDDPAYREKLLKDLRQRKLAPAVECMLWSYAKGKPVERQEVGTPGEFSHVSKEELKAILMEEAAKL
jgi:hypothetical protein